MATDTIPARAEVPADPGFSIIDQRLLVACMRATHRMALTVEDDAAEEKAVARKEQYEADMEKPLDPETRMRFKRQWNKRHAWEPVPSMKGAPKLRNRVVREWQTLSMTNHTVEKCVLHSRPRGLLSLRGFPWGRQEVKERSSMSGSDRRHGPSDPSWNTSQPCDSW